MSKPVENFYDFIWAKLKVIVRKQKSQKIEKILQRMAVCSLFYTLQSKEEQLEELHEINWW